MFTENLQELLDDIQDILTTFSPKNYNNWRFSSNIELVENSTYILKYVAKNLEKTLEVSKSILISENFNDEEVINEVSIIVTNLQLELINSITKYEKSKNIDSIKLQLELFNMFPTIFENI